MKKQLIVGGLTALLCLVGTGASAAGPLNSDSEAEIARQLMERVLGDIAGRGGLETEFRKLDNGVYSLSVSLDQFGPDFVRSIRRSAAKDLNNLHHGHSLTDSPSAEAGLHSSLPTVGADYFFWWSTANLGQESTNKTTILHKGAGKTFKNNFNNDHSAFALNIFTIAEVSHSEAGAYKSSVKVKGAGNAKTKGGCFAQ